MEHPLDAVHSWFSQYVSTMHPEDLDIIALWTAHTHFVPVLYSTGRLLLDSPVPESGKTTVLDHMQRLCLDPLQASSVSSGALLPRLLNERPRTILIDEADRSLSPDNPNNRDIISTVNSGYRRGGTRPVLTPSSDGDWVAKEMSTFGAVAMAGNNPQLADDTRSRTIRVLLMPDREGVVEESDWEFIEPDAFDLQENLAQWAELNSDRIRDVRPPMPEGVKGRMKECWSPLIRVAALAGPEWEARAQHLAARALEIRRAEAEAGIQSVPPKILMLKVMYENWPEGQEQWRTEEIIPVLAHAHPELWEADEIKGRKRVTAQAIGKTLGGSYGITTRRATTRGDRKTAYHRSDFERVFVRMGVAPTPSIKPDTYVTPDTPDTFGADQVLWGVDPRKGDGQ
ncbi:DUF3631 domain-containing protein [Brevibacterium linens]|uniref:DUF3631 domain-containing protein n=1 Tax=Brevibacterium linens TaxID=1703 RepID=UPI003BF54AAB